jgi:hypothetical protein
MLLHSSSLDVTPTFRTAVVKYRYSLNVTLTFRAAVVKYSLDVTLTFRAAVVKHRTVLSGRHTDLPRSCSEAP